jgi:hypothetical protein
MVSRRSHRPPALHPADIGARPCRPDRPAAQSAEVRPGTTSGPRARRDRGAHAGPAGRRGRGAGAGILRAPAIRVPAARAVDLRDHGPTDVRTRAPRRGAPGALQPARVAPLLRGAPARARDADHLRQGPTRALEHHRDSGHLRAVAPDRRHAVRGRPGRGRRRRRGRSRRPATAGRVGAW